MEIRIKINNDSVTKDQISIEIIEPPKVYVPFPAPPVFTDPTTIQLTAAGFNVDNKKLAGKTEIILSDGQTANMSCTYTSKGVKFKGSGKTIIGDGSLDNLKSCVAGLVASMDISLFHVKLNRNHGGLQCKGGTDTNPSNIFLSDVEIEGQTFAGLWVNESTVYKTVNSEFLRIRRPKGEGEYIGSTTKTALSKIAQSNHKHLLVDTTGWDGIQFASVADLLIENATVINAGRENKASHNNSGQFHFCSGVVKNSIFHSSGAMNIFSNGLTFENCYIGCDNPGYSIYLGEWAGLGGKPVTFDNCIFNFETAALLQNAMTSAQLIVKNSIISTKVQKLFSGSGIDGGGNTFAEVTKPVITDDLVTSDLHYYRGMGYRTPHFPAIVNVVTMN